MKKTLLSFITILASLHAQKAVAQQAIAITDDNKVFSFDVSNPASATTPVAITGWPVGLQLAGMDVRPATGQVYLLGYNSTLQTGQLFTFNTTTMAATTVGSPITGLMLTGRVVFDFNPTVDRIRVATSDRQNYRLHPTTGAIVATDGMLAYNGMDVNAGIKPNVGSGAYTNSFIASTATTLYNIDDSLNVLTIQNPPNNGVQNTVGSLGIQINQSNPTTDFDIYFNPVTRTNDAYLAANTGASNLDSLYRVNLSTGMAMAVGALNQPVMDMAILIDRTMPSVSGNLMYALTANNNLVSFYSGTPWYIINAMPVTGLPAGYALAGMDMRPADRRYYALGYNATTMVARVFTLDVSTAALTPVSTDSITNIDLTGNAGVDFNPVADRLRVVTSNNKNYRINQLTGLLAAVDSTLTYNTADVNAGTDPYVATVAYSNSKAGATTTTMYIFDDSLNVFGTQNPPNAGLLNTLATSNIMVNAMDRTSDMDIYYNHEADSNEAYLVANTTDNNDMLYRLSLSSGMVTPVGTIGWGIAIRDFAVQQDSTPVVSGLVRLNTDITQFTAYPNPAENEVTLAFQSAVSGRAVVVISDITGREVAGTDAFVNQGSNEVQLNTSGLKHGVYFATLTLNNGQATIKLIR